ncbi:MAG: phosphatidylcholine/phosphatidylserine synthase [Planctomycetaceae bacterium]
MNRPRMIAVLPTMLTLANAACGFGAITFAAKLGPESAAGNHLLVASLLIFLGMIFDMLDGSAARLTKQTSDIGAQLDSLCDAITFGVAPAFVMLQFVRHEYLDPRDSAYFTGYLGRIVWTAAALYVLCAVMRLARFNVETDDEDAHEIFSGLPSPAAAGTLVSFPIGMRELLRIVENTQSQWLATWLIPGTKIVLVLMTLAVAFLMVSRTPYPHVFNQWFRGQRTRRHIVQLVFIFAAVYWFLELAFPLIFCYFALAAPARAAWSELVGRRLYKSQRA